MISAITSSEDFSMTEWIPSLCCFGSLVPIWYTVAYTFFIVWTIDVSVLMRGGRFGGNVFHEIVSVPNLLDAWKEFKRGKIKKKDIAMFDLRLEEWVFALHRKLITGTYMHDFYEAFFVCDPKRRHIHKAGVRDRVLHQAIFRVLYPIFDPHFIYDSYSSRELKGTHAGVRRLTDACRKVSGNWRRTAYALKCDVRKFFDSIDHEILRSLILKKVDDPGVLWLIDEIFRSFEKETGKALPLGNVTSQLFANVYMNEFDQFAKHSLKAEHYFRYCDDFVIVHPDKEFLESLIPKIRDFLKNELSLTLHPNKVEIRKLSQGIDFLGYVILPHAQIVRTKTKQRLVRKIATAQSDNKKGIISASELNSIVTSYQGVLSHSRSGALQAKIKRGF
jgi:RNA-directed DNA polymerase